ncbi:hypothetical protein Pla52n_23510 [Stieleria varia]|uniref:Uncharacterized protein n=1 Tax=Stieleria varia TaxID=2528005 RepID=A0A5C6AXY3_9BACT|nr:hypothetical protein Pla52n_23510 [Stieleria varia]
MNRRSIFQVDSVPRKAFYQSQTPTCADRPPPSHSPGRLCSTSPKFLGGGDGARLTTSRRRHRRNRPDCTAEANAASAFAFGYGSNGSRGRMVRARPYGGVRFRLGKSNDNCRSTFQVDSVPWKAFCGFETFTCADGPLPRDRLDGFARPPPSSLGEVTADHEMVQEGSRRSSVANTAGGWRRGQIDPDGRRRSCVMNSATPSGVDRARGSQTTGAPSATRGYLLRSLPGSSSGRGHESLERRTVSGTRDLVHYSKLLCAFRDGGGDGAGPSSAYGWCLGGWW